MPRADRGVLNGAVDRPDERRHRLRDCLANRRPEDRKDRRRDFARVPANRFAKRRLDSWRQRTTYLPIALPAKDDRLGEVFGEIRSRHVPVAEFGRKLLQSILFGPDQQMSQGGKFSAAAVAATLVLFRWLGRRRRFVPHRSVLRLLLRRGVSVTRQATHEISQA
jgi:hypothetical protein